MKIKYQPCLNCDKAISPNHKPFCSLECVENYRKFVKGDLRRMLGGITIYP